MYIKGLAVYSLYALLAPQETPVRLVIEGGQAWSGSFDSALVGASVASAGDVNGDGFDDVVVGALGYDAPGGLFDEGAAFVFHGGPQGIQGTGPASAATRIIGTEAAAELGTSVAGAGDVNGDGYDDLIVGAPIADASDLSASGAAYVFLGGPDGIVATSPADADFALESKQIQAHFGTAVAGAGDVNGDGYDDVLVGAALYGRPFDPPIPFQGSGEQGAAFVFLGSANGIVGSDPPSAHAMLVPWADGWPSQSQAGMGYAVSAAGDVNGDGFDDVLVGAPMWNNDRPWPGTETGDPFREGAAFVFLGSSDGVVGRDPTDAHARLEGNRLEALLGSAVAGAGDVNGDGFDDVIVGAPGYPPGDPFASHGRGASFVFHGGPQGIGVNGPEGADHALLGTEVAEWLGRAVGGAGDVDGDGFDDVLVGARTFVGAIADDAVYNGSRRLSGEGIAYLFRGGPLGLQATGLAQAARTFVSGFEGGTAGYEVSGAGDVNGDGRADLLIGCPGYNADGGREGAAFVEWSSSEPPRSRLSRHRL